MNIQFLYGTETGTAEFLCDDLVEATPGNFSCQISELNQADPRALDPGVFYVIVTSTFGSGDLPGTAQTFYDLLEQNKPDLGSIRFAIFGLGDRTFTDTFNFGSKRMMELMLACNAKMVGERGLFDASSLDMPEDVAVPWWNGIVELLDSEQAA